MTLSQSIFLGILEGFTEFLPISSTGHMILASHLLGIPKTPFLASFEIIIQLGAMLAVVVLYFKILISNFKLIKKIAAAFIPTAIVGALLYKIVKHWIQNGEALVPWALLTGGIFLILFEKLYKEKSDSIKSMENITYKQAILIGLAQSIAMIPGVSRSAATICGGLELGLNRKTIVEFSFLLALPTMAAATGLDLLKSSGDFSPENWQLLGVGFVTAFITAIIAIRFMLRFIEKHSFVVFGYYRIAIALIFWLLTR